MRTLRKMSVPIRLNHGFAGTGSTLYERFNSPTVNSPTAISTVPQDCKPSKPPIGTLKRMAKARKIQIPKVSGINGTTANQLSNQLSNDIYMHSVATIIEDTLIRFAQRYTLSTDQEKLFIAIMKKRKIKALDLAPYDAIYISSAKALLYLGVPKSRVNVITLGQVLGIPSSFKTVKVPKDVSEWKCYPGGSALVSCIQSYVTEACKEARECYGIGFSNRMKGLPARLVAEFTKLQSKLQTKLLDEFPKTANKNNNSPKNERNIELPNTIKLKAYVVSPLKVAIKVMSEVAKSSSGATQFKADSVVTLLETLLQEADAAYLAHNNVAIDHSITEVKGLQMRNINDLRELSSIATERSLVIQHLNARKQAVPFVENNKKIIFDYDYKNILASTDHLAEQIINAVFSNAPDAMDDVRKTLSIIKSDYETMAQTFNRDS